jgi:hypothetical protein
MTGGGGTAARRGAALAAVPVLVAAILAVDVMLPAGIAVGVLYVGPVLLALYAGRRAVSLAVAAVCTLLLPVGFLLSPVGAAPWVGVSNRFLSAAAIWITVVLSLRDMQARGEVHALRGLLPICASCKNLRLVNGTWQPVDRYLEALSNAILSHSICPRCVEKWYPDLYPELAERRHDPPQRP